MIKVTIQLFARSSWGVPGALMRHSDFHIDAVVEDMGGTSQKQQNFYSEVQDSSKAVKTVVLYSDKTFAEYLQWREENNPPLLEDQKLHRKIFSAFFNNCADHMNRALSFLFPETSMQTQCYSLLLKLFCCCPNLCFFGNFSCFPVPPGINTPQEVFLRAEMIAELQAQERHPIGLVNMAGL